MRIKLFKEGTKLPEKKREGDAGWDIYLPEDVVFMPYQTTVVDLCFGVEIPKGYAGLLAMRSSVCKKDLQIQMPLIDSNYRGSIHLMIYNPGFYPAEYKAGERVCSLFVFPVFDEALEVVDELSESNRGENWSGSSGK